jgi:hypothetical protein
VFAPSLELLKNSRLGSVIEGMPLPQAYGMNREPHSPRANEEL